MELTYFDSALKMPLMSLPLRSTLITLSSNAKVMISPCPSMSDADIHAANGITDIVAPSCFHYLGAQKAKRAFPNATLWAAPGLAEKKPKLKWDRLLTPETWPYQDELEAISIQGMPKVNEVVFLHRASKTLIVSDLCFNMVDATGVGSWMILNLFGTYRKFGVSKFFLKFVADRPAFENSIKDLFTRDFDHLVMGHGNIVNGNAKSLLAQAFLERGFQV